MKLSKPQDALLKRIKRCPKGCYVAPSEYRTAEVLHKLGLITTNASFTIAWPVEGK